MLEWRNHVYNRFGTIDMEINHPQFGWIPFTANPHDPEPIGLILYEAALKSQIKPKPYVEPEPIPEPEPVKTEVQILREELDALRTELSSKGVIKANLTKR